MTEFTVLGLRVVREAARQGSFSIAAERLGYTQSAISRQIALMERAAGRPLFERHARGVRPTEAGRVVLRHAEGVFGAIDAVHQDLQDLGGRPPGRLRVGAFSTAMAALVPHALAALAQREPQVRVPLREGLSPRLLTAVERGRLDLAVVTRPRQPPDGVEIVPLLDDPLFVAVARDHPLAGQASVTPEALRGQRWIAGSAEPGSTMLGAWAGAAWQPDIAYVARDWVAKLGLVAAGLGVTMVPGLAVPALASTISLVRIEHPDAVRATTVAHRPGTGDERLRRMFTEALRDSAAELSAQTRHKLQ